MYLVRSGAIEGFEKLVIELGGNPIVLLDQLGLGQELLRNPNTYISYSRLAELLEISADTCASPLFGLLLARHQNSSVLGDLSLIPTRHHTARGAIEEISRHLYLHASGVRLQEQVRGNDIQLGLVFDFSSPRGLNQLIQLSIAHLAIFTAELLGMDRYALPLYLRQPAPSGPGPLSAEAFQSRILFDARSDSIRVPGRWLERKSQWNEELLRRHFQDYLLQLRQRYPDNLADQVRDIIGRLLPSGECSLERVAATLDLHTRVLQKRLQGLGSGYGGLLRETRRDIAEQHLRHRAMPITELALNLGYAEVAVFSRNFKQWTGYSPRQWQARFAATDSGSPRSSAGRRG